MRKLLVAICIFMVSCKTTQQASDVKVVGGREALEGELPAAIRIHECSATRIAQTLILTAAHCVLHQNHTLKDTYQIGGALRIDYGIRLNDAKFVTVNIKNIFIHNSYFSGVAIGAGLSDVAIIEITEPLPDAIQIAKIRPAAVKVGEEVVFSGFGCEELPNYMRPEFGGDAVASGDSLTDYELQLRLKIAREPIIDYTKATGQLASRNYSQNVHSEQSEFSGCPGDSGSGVYAANPGETSHLQVVGVNSYINLFRTVFARIDRGAANDIHSCLLVLINKKTAKPSCFKTF